MERRSIEFRKPFLHVIKQALILPNLDQFKRLNYVYLSHIATLSHDVYPQILRKSSQFLKSIEIPKEKWSFPASYSPYENVWCLSTKKWNQAVSKMGTGLIEMLRLQLDSQGFYFLWKTFSFLFFREVDSYNFDITI
jgi:hypothetical protein